MSGGKVWIQSGGFRKLLKSGGTIELIDQRDAQVQVSLCGCRFEGYGLLKILDGFRAEGALPLPEPPLPADLSHAAVRPQD